MAEVMVDVINSALGVEENWGPNGKSDIKPGSKAVEVGASQIAQAQAVNYTLRIFGRPPRTAACDCERAMEPALPQTLYFMTDQSLLDKLKNSDGRLAKLGTNKTNDEVLDELFLATLSRLPTAQHRQVFAAGLQRVNGNRQAALNDTLWALMNTREFRLQH